MSSPTENVVNPEDPDADNSLETPLPGKAAPSEDVPPEKQLISEGNLDGAPQENLIVNPDMEPDNPIIRPVIEDPGDVLVSEGNLDEVASENQDAAATSSSCNPDEMARVILSMSQMNLNTELQDSTYIKRDTPNQKIEKYFLSSSEEISSFIFVTCEIFYDLLKDESLKILVLDCSSDKHYKKAHVKCKYIVNIPSDIIIEGLKLNTIVKLMGEEIRKLFESYSFDLVIIMDEDTNCISYSGSKLEYLRAILIDDNKQKYQILPLVLSEGISMYAYFYPTDIISKDTYNEVRVPRVPKFKSDFRDTHPGTTTTERKESEILKLLKKIEALTVRELNIEKAWNDFSEGQKNLYRREQVEIKNRKISLRKDLYAMGEPRLTDAEQTVIDSWKDLELQVSMTQKQNNKPALPSGSTAERKHLNIPVLEKFRNSGYRGLVNIKNTCYMNSIIQCLHVLPTILSFFHYNIDYIKNNTLTSKLGRTILSLWDTNVCKAFKPEEIYSELCARDPQQTGYSQGKHEDAHEFYTYLMTTITNEMQIPVNLPNEVKEKAYLWLSLFNHKLEITTTCSNCKQKPMVTYDYGNTIFLPLPPENKTIKLQVAIGDFFNEILEDENCTSCKSKIERKKKLIDYPKILVINLARYKYCLKERTVLRCSNKCVFSEDITFGGMEYHLRSISLHSGDRNYGHYTTLGYHMFAKRWLTYNDEYVDWCHNIHTNESYEKTYVLFYTLDKGTDAMTFFEPPDKKNNTADLEKKGSVT